MKFWNTGLVCESCKRKAAGLTLVKTGDVRGDLLVGKKVCYTCLMRTFRQSIDDEFESRWLLIAELAVLTPITVSLLITWFLKADSTIPAVLLVLFFVFVWVERSIRTRRNRGLKPKRRSEPLVSTEKLFPDREI